jgi:hypothetical protein
MGTQIQMPKYPKITSNHLELGTNKALYSLTHVPNNGFECMKERVCNVLQNLTW